MSFPNSNTQFAMEPSVRRETELAQEAAGLTDPVPQVVAAGKFGIRGDVVNVLRIHTIMIRIVFFPEGQCAWLLVFANDILRGQMRLRGQGCLS